ncbi:hypothetical protein B0H17DRAFT_26237 [Mycena rosella]|uniref:F-box domain-containing protein n=1 Tax=Mycena rosella TaxID=1033263 RepID=A0AAD7D909_MYCRO|nr:hypothetical protein B0H17DRAFT_26237 [Mycena rosella]
MNLSRLRIIRISGGEDGATDEATLGLIPDIVSESVRHVHLSDFHSLSYTTLTRILEKPCALEGLHFHECTASESEPSDLFPLPISPKHHLTHLSLSSSASIAQWLVRPGFPLDFSNLICAEISRSSNGTVATILEGVRGTLKSLTVAGEDFDPTIVTFKYWSPFRLDDFRPIQLLRFPALTHLGIALDLPFDIVATLPAISEITNRNTIQEIIYTIQIPHLLDGEPQAAAEQSSTWPTFDAGIAALPLPHLERVEIMFLENPDDYLDPDQPGAARAAPQHLDAASFPLLSERKLLFLTTQYYQ